MRRYEDRDGVVDAVLADLPDPGREDATGRMLPPECYASEAFFAFEQAVVFARTWICVGHEQQIPQPGDHLSADVAGEPLLVVRTAGGAVHAMSALCRHRGASVDCGARTGSPRRGFRCPLHFWTYDLEGRLLNAPRWGDREAVEALRRDVRLPPVRVESWHGFLFVNLDPGAPPLGPTLTKVEPFWSGFATAGLVAVPPAPAEAPLPWNWKVHAENFIDAYHPEFVHRGTHDFAPSVHAAGGVEFTAMGPRDNAIVRSVPLLEPDGGMTDTGWGADAAFPPVDGLSPEQRRRLTFVLIPPSLQLVFAPGAVAYTLLRPVGAAATLASSDRVTTGGWLLPRTTLDRPDFAERAAAVQEGARRIWAQDVPVNLGMQRAKAARLVPPGVYGPLEVTLRQLNGWYLRAYRDAAGRGAAG